jgi:hypothetical protein
MTATADHWTALGAPDFDGDLNGFAERVAINISRKQSRLSTC